MSEMWLIWSLEHAAWWNPNGVGYCVKRSDAGRFTLEVARELVRLANLQVGDGEEPQEAMILDE